MSFLPSLPEDARLLDVFRAYPEPARSLLEYHEVLLRGPSPLSVGERERIAAYVSELNGCGYCHRIHSATAEHLGARASMDDGRLEPLLRYVRKLTQTPADVSEADANAVLTAGWDERALHDAVSVCALFNFMNRLVEGLGITADEAYVALSARRLTEGGYAGLTNLLDA